MSHESFVSITDDWLTPPEIIERLGPFDLDPCASENQPWETAIEMRTRAGLQDPWHGFVWVNPPYSNTRPFLAHLARHGEGIALVFARTDSRIWRKLWQDADAFLFLFRRLRFHRPLTGEKAATAGAPSVLVGFGKEASIRLRKAGLEGAFVENVKWIRCGQQTNLLTDTLDT